MPSCHSRQVSLCYPSLTRVSLKGHPCGKVTDSGSASPELRTTVRLIADSGTLCPETEHIWVPLSLCSLSKPLRVVSGQEDKTKSDRFSVWLSPHGSQGMGCRKGRGQELAGHSPQDQQGKQDQCLGRPPLGATTGALLMKTESQGSPALNGDGQPGKLLE